MSNHAKHVAPKQNTRSVPKAVAEVEPDWIEEDAADGRSSAKNPGSGTKKGPKKGVVATIVVVATILILLELVYLIFGHFYSKMNYSSGLSDADRAAAIASYADLTDPGEVVDDDALANSATADEVGDMQARIQAQLAAMGGSVMSDSDVVNVLLVGTDARTRNERARSDVMMLASLNKRTHKIVLTSFMRDIYTYIPDYGYNRLNAPYAIAGPDYLIETLEADFGVKIDNYAAVNFYDFADIIDAIGGVDVDLTTAEVDFINGQAYNGEQANLGVGTGSIYLDYSADGHYHLNGTQALAHCRNRSSIGSDFDRTNRQRTVIAAMIEKATTLPLSELYSLVSTILPLVTTDLTQADCLSLLLKSGEYLSYDRVSLRIPDVEYSNATISGMSVISIDFAANAAVLQDTIYN